MTPQRRHASSGAPWERRFGYSRAIRAGNFVCVSGTVGINPDGSYVQAGPLRDKKGFVTEGGIRIPGMIRWPGHVRGGTISDEPVCGVDFLPTICEIVGIQPPKDRMIVSHLSGNGVADRDGPRIAPRDLTRERVEGAVLDLLRQVLPRGTNW